MNQLYFVCAILLIMKFCVLLTLCASALCIPLDRSVASIDRMPDQIRGLIVGGEETTVETFPWIVSLQRHGEHFCGGSIISTTRILSAAHCTFFGTTDTLFIRAGSTNNLAGGQLVGASQIINHPDYELQTTNNDISIVILNSPLDTSLAGIAIVALPLQDAGVPVGAMAYVAGWGFLCENCYGTNILNFVAVPVISNAQCSTLYNGITAGMLMLYLEYFWEFCLRNNLLQVCYVLDFLKEVEMRVIPTLVAH